MEYITLNNGVEMPKLGFGVYQIPEQDAEEVVLNAIESGYRSFDTAHAYLNEEGVGRAIKRSNVPREELFITTKLWIAFAGYESTLQAFDAALERLQLDYIDMYLIHQPFGDVYGSWRAMEELYDQGKIRAIGVCNFAPGRLRDLAAFNKVTPQLNQIDINPFTQRITEIEQMKSINVQPEAWAPFAEGKNDIFNNEVLTAIGEKYNKSAAQVILRWFMQRDIVVIPKSANVDRMKQNIEIFDFELTAEDMEAIQTIDTAQSLFYDHQDFDVTGRFIELGQRRE